MLAAVPVIAVTGASTAAAATDFTEFRGVHWSRLGDNATFDPLVLQGMSATDTYSSARSKADAMFEAFQVGLDANTVRLPVNPATVNTSWWNTYKAVVDAALARGFKVVLSYWTEDSGSKPPNMDSWNAMWDTLTNMYASNPLVYFSPQNEPWDGLQSWLDRAAKWISDRPEVPRNRIFLDGYRTVAEDYGSDLRPLCNDHRLDGTMLAFHLYGFQVAYATEQEWKNKIKTYIGDCASRTVIEEFGAPADTGADYSDPNSPDKNVPYLRAMVSVARELGLGSIWCHVIGGRIISPDHDELNILRLNSATSILPLWVPNMSAIDQVRFAWGMGPSIPTAPTGPLTRIEAENAALLGGARVEPHSNASNGQNVGWMLNTGDGTTFSNLYASNRLDIGYAATSAGTFSLYVNGDKTQEISFPATGGWNGFAEKTVDVTIPAGATVTLKRDAGDSAINLDYIEQPREAEYGVLLNGARAEVRSGNVNGMNVGYLLNTGAGVAFRDMPASSKLDIHYAAMSAGTFSLYVNGDKTQEISFPATGGWNDFAEKTVDVTIPAGATVTLKRDAGDSAINLDYIA
ncbi:carbohydrate-binding protein [Streptomyces sp. NPDC051976]|uniref:carbohydrate-binding protein n=1 Tax=Streptomyces sp. NPDC051976 TaxID=3154947 RepID=UPI0034302A7E